jgi:hypothetical protein
LKYNTRGDVDGLCDYLKELPFSDVRHVTITSACASMRQEKNINALLPFTLKAIQFELLTAPNQFNSLLHAFCLSSYTNEFAEFIEFLALKRVPFDNNFFILKCAMKFDKRDKDSLHRLVSMIALLDKEGVYVPTQVID